MKAYVINLLSRPDRLKEIKKRFKDSEFEIKRINAVRNKEPHIGVTKSFLKALKKAKKEKIPEVLLLEDDCKPLIGWKSRWKKIKKWLDVNEDKWDIYSGGAWNIIMPTQIGKIDDIIIYKPLYSLAAHWIYVPERSYDLLINAYTSFLSIQSIIPMAGLDHYNNIFKTVISKPFMATQTSDMSNTTKKYRNTDKLFKNAEERL